MRAPQSPPERNQIVICMDTVRNPSLSLLGGPDAEEAERILREKYAATDADIAKLKG